MHGSHMTRGRQKIENSSNSNSRFGGFFRISEEKSLAYVNVVKYNQLTKMTLLLSYRFLFRRST